MDILKAIFTRRSIRKYTNEKINEDSISFLLEAGMYAPSAVNKQPWHFIVFRDREKMKAIIEVHPNSYMLADCDTAILVCWDELAQHDAGYGPVDCAAATQNILLAAHGTGLGAVWVGIYPREARMQALHKLFELPDNIRPFSVISLGHPDEKKEKPFRFNKEKIHYEKW